MFNTSSVAVSNYLFAGNSLFDPSSSTPDTVIEDFSDFASGDIEEEKEIAAGDSFGLITFDFDATGSPAGFFYIKLPAFVGEMEPWYLPPLDAETFFANAPPGGDPAIVAMIGINVETTSVPEPSTLRLVGLAPAFLLGWLALRRAQSR